MDNDKRKIKKEIRTKFLNKTLEWGDLKKLKIEKQIDDKEPFEKRLGYHNELFPLLIHNDKKILTTKGEWKDINQAYEFYLGDQKKVNFKKAVSVEKGICIFNGNISKTFCIEFINSLLDGDYILEYKKYSPTLTKEEMLELYDDGIYGDRSNKTYAYFRKN